MTDLTPREIVSELDRFIIGQNDAKRAVAVALRSRWRRKQLSTDLRDEVYPKNIDSRINSEELGINFFINDKPSSSS